MKKSHAAHLNNLQRKFPYYFGRYIPTGSVPYRSMDQMMSDMLTEIYDYEEAYGPEAEATQRALDYVIKEKDPFGGLHFSTNFNFFQRAAADPKLFHELDPVTERAVLEVTGRYGTVWGTNWYVSREMPDNEIWVIDACDHKYIFILKDDGVYLREKKIITKETKI
jgi:hypothetical protein